MPASKADGEARTGVSGWAYPSWRNDFYPTGLPHRRELEYTSTRLRTLEINASFYSLRRPENYQQWRRETADGCVFAVKGGRFITHTKRLRGGRAPLANFFASGVLALDDKLGPFLWQLPAALPYDERQLSDFLSLLPRDTTAAKRLGRHHDSAVEGRTWLGRSPVRTLRHAIEVRHPSYGNPDFLDLLREHSVALVVSDNPGSWPVFDQVTADFVYVRLHGHERLYAGGYSPRSLAEWAARTRRWTSEGLDVFAYFDNDMDGRAPHDAVALAALLGDAEMKDREQTSQD